MNYLRYGKNWVIISQGNKILGKLMKKTYLQLRMIDNNMIFIHFAKKFVLIEYEIY